MPDSRYYAQGEELLHKFAADPVHGLTSEAVTQNRQRYGANELTPPKKDPLWKQYFEKFTDPTIIILCACAAIALLIGFYEGKIPWDGLGIFIAVMLATGGSTYSEYKADKAFELLKRDSDRIRVKVIRNGEFHSIDNNDLVAGDLIKLEVGDKVPGDAALLKSIDLMVDESLMTGESEPVHKGAQDARLAAGTYCVMGSGLAIVEAVGDRTKLGNIASALGRAFVCPMREHRKVYKDRRTCDVCGQSLVPRREGETPLQQKLTLLASRISEWGFATAVFIFLALWIAAAYGNKMGDISRWKVLLTCAIAGTVLAAAILAALRKVRLALWGGALILGSSLLASLLAAGGGGDWLKTTHALLGFFMIAVTIVVVAVPEGLPMAVVIALGCSMRKIRQDNNLVRKMLATETIGSVTVLCTDKTGTLTKNQMAVREVFLLGERLNDQNMASVKDSALFELLSLACAVNSTAEVEHLGGHVRFVGNPTEGALLAWLEQRGLSYQEMRSRMPIHNRACFSADRKMMTTLTGNDTCGNCDSCPVAAELSSVGVERDGCRLVFTKGAPERVLPKCSRAHVDGLKTRLLDECRDEFDAYISGMAEKGIRPLAIAYRVEHRGETPSGEEAAREMERNLTLLSIVGIADPIREDVPDAVRTCGQAGIDVKMVTGDHPATARAVAKQVGMLAADDVVLGHEEFAAKSDEELKAILPRLRVLARAEPLDKERLVTLLQGQGHVVGMTGDATNDAPALKAADVGLAMGLRGTDVAKEASDIVLTDDNFGSIVRAVQWGRSLYENLQKFLQFQLTVNYSALLIALLSPLLVVACPEAGFQSIPLTVLQFLWINLIMDTLGALAFGLEPPRPEVMQMKPKRRDDSFLTRTMLGNIVVVGTCFVVLILVLQATDFLGARALGDLGPNSVLFNLFVWLQIFNMFNARSVISGRSAFSGLSQSRSFFYIMGFIIAVQFLLVQFGGRLVNTMPLPPMMWGKIILIAATVLILGEAVRLAQRAFGRRKA